MKILRTAAPAESTGPAGPADAAPAPPVTAKIVASGKTERELLLERQNSKLVVAVKKTADSRRKAEEKAALVIRENQLLKQAEQKAVASQKASWMGFGAQ